MKGRFKTDAIRHYYKLKDGFKTTSTYQFVKTVNNQPSQLNQLIKIDDYKGYSRAKDLSYYLTTKNCKTWKDSKQITGLTYLTSSNNVFYGDDIRTGQKSSLIIVYFRGDILIIDYFLKFYPEGNVKTFISEYVSETTRVLNNELSTLVNDLKPMQLGLFDKDSE